MNMKTFKKAWPLAILATAVVLSACEQGEGATKDDDKEKTAPIPVETASVIRGNIDAVYSGTATLESDEEAQVIAKVGGEIVAILVEEGDIVKPGQVLARLDGDRLRLEVQQARANLAGAEQEYRRNVELHETGLISATAFEDLKYEVDQLKATYDLAQLNLGYTEIRAPIGGYVSERLIKLGNTITENTPVFRVTDMNPLLAYLHVPERDLSKLRSGQPAQLVLDALPGQSFTGTIVRISPVIDPQTGTFKATIEVPDTTSQLKPGMFGRFNIVYETREDTVLIPRVALVDEDTEPAVFVVEEGVAYRRAVTTALTRSGNVEIADGLVGNEQIVIVGQSGLKEGTKVEVIGLTAEQQKDELADGGTADVVNAGF